jgi:hypothetical protein
MAKERYPGERRGLSLFLDDLRSCALEVCGADSLLVHAIRRALHTGDLDHLRHARTLFNHLPREQRQALSAACVTPAAERRPPADELLERYSDREPEPFVSFERRGEADGTARTEVTLTHELLPASGVRVMVSPGTLPTTAAGDLRRIANMIENDRRLLSDRYWRRGDEDRSRGPAGQAPNSSS